MMIWWFILGWVLSGLTKESGDRVFLFTLIVLLMILFSI